MKKADMVKRDEEKKRLKDAAKKAAVEQERKRKEDKIRKDNEKHAKAVTSKQKAPTPDVVVPFDPENKYISKKDFIAKNVRIKAKSEAMAKFEAEYDAEQAAKKREVIAKKQEAVDKKEDSIPVVQKPEK